MKTRQQHNSDTSASFDWSTVIDNDPLEVVVMLGSRHYLRRGEAWTSGDATIIRNQFGHVQLVTGNDFGIQCRHCSNLAELRKALLARIPGSVTLSDEHLQQLIAEAVEVRMSYRTFAGEDFLVYDTGRSSGEQVVITPGAWAAVPPQFACFPRDGYQIPSALPAASFFTIEEYDEAFGFLNYTDNLVSVASFTGVLDPRVPTPWLLFVGNRYQRRLEPLAWTKLLLDPACAPNFYPTSAAEVVQQLQRQRVAAFDNVHAWPSEFLDALLELKPPFDLPAGDKSVEEDAVWVALAGDKNVPYSKELMEHCLPVGLLRSTNAIEGIADFTEGDFLECRGSLLGSLFSVLAQSMLLREPVVDDEFPASLRPFVSHGRAVAVALGHTPDDFDSALRDSLELRAALCTAPEEFVEPGLDD